MQWQIVKKLQLPFLFLVLPGLAFILFLPYFPVDETRYLSVAWEMWLNNSFIVPIQNGLPYSHKPPFLFWLFNLDWLVFGVNEWTLRFIPLLFSLANVALVFRIAMTLWEDEKLARYATVILASTLSYLLWSSVIMFDVILAFWILVAVLALVSAGRGGGTRNFLLAGVAIGVGILTKGPVVLVYVLPVGILSFLWIPREHFSWKWYGWLLLSLGLGLAVVLIWLVPAAMTGGETYRRAILWGQTVNRMANSFAHKRPLWWYLPWIPLLLMPWILFPPAFRGLSRIWSDAGGRVVLIWTLASLAVFSLLSGKQVHYMIPVLPAFSLLIAKSVADFEKEQRPGRWHLPVAGFYLLLGAALMTASFINHGRLVRNFDGTEIRTAAAGLMLIGTVMALQKPRTMTGVLHLVAASSPVCLALAVIGGNSFFHRYELHPMAEAIRLKQEQGYSVIHKGKYHGQFHFVGRLREPLLELEKKEEIAGYVAKHEKVALVTYEGHDRRVGATEIFFKQPFRSKQAILWNKKGISRLLAPPK